jgi:hypothetical protein
MWYPNDLLRKNSVKVKNLMILPDLTVLYEGQFGFQSKVSTVHHLLKLTNFVAEQLNNKNYVVGIFLDLKKAFDVVPHDILLKKLKKWE